MNNLLEAKNIEKSFGGIKALDNISFSVPENSIVSIIGPNGSGKTTFLNCVNGIYTPEKGSLKFKGQELIHKKPHEIAKLGISRTFQVARMFQKISVIDNILAPVLGSKSSMGELRKEASVN
ncbi:MAG: ATP-binding cassette domain-containing protein [Desulfobacula sp.]|uniref:ATP-binding cassette domain-containing protein n=1 Tax=Desulfobacula sp. TaxID=2593537 RepID=UPI0039B8C5FB|nr:ATP-binding cassette domain-containing protein [Desulfobacula sp.]